MNAPQSPRTSGGVAAEEVPKEQGVPGIGGSGDTHVDVERRAASREANTSLGQDTPKLSSAWFQGSGRSGNPSRLRWQGRPAAGPGPGCRGRPWRPDQAEGGADVVDRRRTQSTPQAVRHGAKPVGPRGAVGNYPHTQLAHFVRKGIGAPSPPPTIGRETGSPFLKGQPAQPASAPPWPASRARHPGMRCGMRPLSGG